MRIGRVAGGVLCLLATVPASASAATITVNSVGDAQAEDAACTLREAIVAVNTNLESGNGSGGAPECIAGQAPPTVDVIQFSIAGAGPHTISPGATALPAITQAVTIDGSTEPNEVRLDGVGAPALSTGLEVGADDVTIDELTIVRFEVGVDLSGTVDAVLRDSFIGTDPAGTSGLGNDDDGVRLGFDDLATSGARVRDNVISGNGTEGIAIREDASQNDVTGNRIGTTPGGNGPLANGQEGIEVVGAASSNTVGGDQAQDQNLISGNGTGGVRFFNSGLARGSGNAVVGNRIGTRVAGENAEPNGGAGVTVTGAFDQTEIRGNLISGNTDGVNINDAAPQPAGEAGPTDTVVAGNLIGTDKDGEALIANTISGVNVIEINDHRVRGTVIGGASGLTPGGPCAGDCNLIAGVPVANATVRIEGPDGTEVLGNHIGTDLAGTAGLSNFDDGIEVREVTGVQIGAPGAGNVIADNGGNGILIVGNSAGTTTGNVVQANTIGLGSDGSTPLGNTDSGVFIGGFASENLIGGVGAGEGNTIAESIEDEGVTLQDDATDNAILGNSIHSNEDLGIDINNDTVTLNDAADLDTGVNDLQNHPEISVAVAAGEQTAVVGELDSTPDSDFRVEVFADAGDPQDFGEGREFLGSFEVTTDAAGLAPFATTVGASAAGDAISATATELSAGGDPLSTSEFGRNAEAQPCDVPGSSADDVLTGNGATSDIVCGLEGDDVFTPDGGDDVFVGGTQMDEIDYSANAAGITADLETGVVVSLADDQTVVGVEDVTGTDFDDAILGNARANLLNAGAGRDTVEARDGDDELVGSDGVDTLSGGDGTDELKGQDGGDSLRGQSGNNDDLSGGSAKDNLNGGGGSGDDCNGGGNRDDTPAPGCESTSSIP